MNCPKCGTEVGVGDFFCPTCGNKLSQNQPLVSDIKVQGTLPNSTFTKFSYSRSYVIGYFINMIFALISVAVFFTLCLMAEANVHIKISRGYYFAFNGYFKWLFTFLTVVMLLIAVMHAIRCVILYKMCLCVYTNKIVGVSAKNLCFATEEFEIEYSNIIDIKQKRNLITVETNIKVYRLIIQDAKQAYDMIMSLRNGKSYGKSYGTP